MRGYFDEKEPELEEPEPRAEPDRREQRADTRLGARCWGLFICLVLICGLCFGLGYTLGRRHSAPAAAAAAPHASETPAPEQEPLQASGTVPKPSADAQAPVPLRLRRTTMRSLLHRMERGREPGACAAQPGASRAWQPAGACAANSRRTAYQPAGASTAAPAKTRVRPAMPSPANTPHVAQTAAPSNVHAALPAQADLMVQIAAVSNQEDANVLMSALRKRGYTVTSRREPADGLIHVRIGPFSSRDEANRWRNKLLSDGYNAEVQQ